MFTFRPQPPSIITRESMRSFRAASDVVSATQSMVSRVGVHLHGAPVLERGEAQEAGRGYVTVWLGERYDFAEHLSVFGVPAHIRALAEALLAGADRLEADIAAQAAPTTLCPVCEVAGLPCPCPNGDLPSGAEIAAAMEARAHA